MADKKEVTIFPLHLENGLHKAFKVACVAHGRTMSGLIRLLMASYLENNPPSPEEVTPEAWTRYLDMEKREKKKRKTESFKYL